MSTENKFEHALKKSVCDRCECGRVGCQFECLERAAERWRTIRAQGLYIISRGSIGKHRIHWDWYRGGHKA